METPPFRRLAGRLGKKGNWKTPGNRTFDESLDITVFASALAAFLLFLVLVLFQITPLPFYFYASSSSSSFSFGERSIHRAKRAIREVIVSAKLEIEIETGGERARNGETARYVVFLKIWNNEVF